MPLKWVKERSLRGLSYICLLILIALHIVFHTVNITFLDEYSTYDEGTHLLIARFINNGILPYRDIFTVHPPLFYYTLALWQRLFGDTYLTGRLFIIFIGSISLILAYIVGKEAKDEITGISFAVFLSLETTFFIYSNMVFMEVFLIALVLVSIWYYIKYTKTKKLEYGVLSLFWASLSSTAKLTTLPYVIALYIVIIMTLDENVKRYARALTFLIFSKASLYLLVGTYLIYLPVRFVGYILSGNSQLFITPGFQAVKLKDHVLIEGLFLITWGVLFLYYHKISYKDKVLMAIEGILSNLPIVIGLALVAILPKLLVEGTLGILVSCEYVNMVYGSNHGRIRPLTGIFSILHHITTSKLVEYTPLVVLLAGMFLVSITRRKAEPRRALNDTIFLGPLLLANILMYLLGTYTFPTPRYSLPLYLIFYLVSLIYISNANKKMFVGILIASMVLMATVDYSLLSKMESRDIKPLLDRFKDDVSLYSATVYSVNPMNAYYLNLTVDPYTIDSFGLVLLQNDSDLVLETIYEKDYLLLSTWNYIKLRGFYSQIEKNLVFNGTLVYAESTKNNVLKLFSLDGHGKKIGINSMNRRVYLLFPDGLKLVISASKRDPRWSILKNTNGTAFVVTQHSEKNATVLLMSYRNSNKLRVNANASLRLNVINGILRPVRGGIVLISENHSVLITPLDHGYKVVNSTIYMNPPVEIRLIDNNQLRN